MMSPSSTVNTPTLICLKCSNINFNVLMAKGIGVLVRCAQCGLAHTVPDENGNMNQIGVFSDGGVKTDA